MRFDWRISSSETEWHQWLLFCFKGPNEIPHRQKITTIIITVVQFGAMVGKVAVAQTLVRRTQQDFNMSELAHGGTTFLNIMTE